MIGQDIEETLSHYQNLQFSIESIYIFPSLKIISKYNRHKLQYHKAHITIILNLFWPENDTILVFHHVNDTGTVLYFTYISHIEIAYYILKMLNIIVAAFH